MLAASTHDQDVFSFYPDDRYCNGFEDLLTRYREIVPKLKLAGALWFTMTEPICPYILVN